MKKGIIELLAFLCMIKNAQANSVLYEDAAYKMAKKVGLSDGKILKKYLTKCLDLGLCEQHEQRYNTSSRRTVYKFISYHKAITKLTGYKGAQLRCFPIHKNIKGFKNIQYQIELDAVSLNIKQQAYKASSNFPNKHNIIRELQELSQLPVSERTTRAAKARRTKLMKRLRNADAVIQQSRSKGHTDGVVTGCKGVAKQIGRGNTTGHKRIKKWMDAGILQAHDIVHFQPTASKESAAYLIESLIQSGVKGIHLYSLKEKGVKTILGKRVIGFISAKYSYGIHSDDNSSYTFSK